MIPGMFKFLSRLVLMPAGDREKGLLYIRDAADGESIFETDFEILHYTICFMFEGRYEEGLAGIRRVWERFPLYERAAAPSLLMRPLIPTAGLEDDKKIDALITRGESSGRSPRHEVALLHFFRAYAARFYESPATASGDLRAVAEADFDHPDWASDYARLELARLWAARGRIEQAHPLLVEVGGSSSHGYLRELARETLKDLQEKPLESGVIDGSWAAKVYRSSPADRRDVIERLSGLDRRSLHAAFYLGDALLLDGDLDGALAVFEDILATEVPRWAEEYIMFAACRAAEICGARGEYDKAAHFLSRALKSYSKEYLLDWIIEGRQRYYERLARGEDEPAPGLFSSNPR
jgi:tetratricopeptide (TPR) repeat protein